MARRPKTCRPKRAAGRLLILACSATKREGKTALPAIELYDGVNFRVLRKFFVSVL